MSVREHVTLQMLAVEPTLDFKTHHLRSDVDDDYLLASVIEWKQTHTGERVVLITADIGLMVKAHHHGIETIEVPDLMRLPAEVDPDEARIRELEDKVRELQGSMPELLLCFSNRENRVVLALESPVAPSPGRSKP